MAELAARLGIGQRHLTRLFAQHLGASPGQIARTLRLQRAKRLLSDSDAPLSQIALETGFGSLRRFNAAIVDLYGRPPSALRGACHRVAAPLLPRHEMRPL